MTPRQDLAVAVRAATGAAALADSFFRRSPRVRVKSAPGDLVSEADTEGEEYVRKLVSAERPDDGLLGEEGSRLDGTRLWLVDAVDGTLNFVHGDPFWCTAVSLEDADGPLVAAVHHAASGETFSAMRGEGCWLNDEPLKLGPGVALKHAVLATYLHPGDAGTATLRRVLPRAASLRIRGSGTLELAWLAAGRVDAWLQRDVNPWDWTPGALLVRESGGVSETVDGADGSWSFASGAASSGELRAAIEGRDTGRP